MFEDSMKNTRAYAAPGMRTVLLDETGGASTGEEALLGDIAAAGE